MTLTTADQTYIQNTIVQAIEQLVLPRFDAIDRDIVSMKADIAQLKADVQELKEDVRVLKLDVQELKDDVRILKDDMRVAKAQLTDMNGRLQALEADVKELYFMQKKKQNAALTDKKFAKLPLEAKIHIIDHEVVEMAKTAGIKLQRPY